MIDNAGLKTDVKRFIVIMLMTGVAGFSAGFAFRRGFFLPVLFFIVGFIAPLLYLSVRKK